MLKAIIVEDEYLAREELSYLIRTYNQIQVVDSFDDGLEAFKFLQSNKVDIIFLDINIPSIDGMLLARNIHQFSQKPQIVFTTAYKEHAAEAFDLEAFDYLLKPLNEERVKRLLTKLEQFALPQPSAANPVEPSMAASASTINLVRDNRIRVTPIDDIAYAEAKEKITLVYTHDGEFVAPCSISELIEKLPAQQFFRSHRSFCVNTRHIQEIIPWVNSTYLLKMSDVEGDVPVSRSNIKAFRELMHL